MEGAAASPGSLYVFRVSHQLTRHASLSTRAYLAKSLKLAPERIDPQAKFARLGMDSAASVFLVADLEDWLGIELSVELMFEYQTPAALARYLAARCAAQKSAIG